MSSVVSTEHRDEPTRFSDRYKEYVRSNFITLQTLAANVGVRSETIEDLASRKMLPDPTYTFEDGTKWYPNCYAALLKEARSEGLSFADYFRKLMFSIVERLTPDELSTFASEENTARDDTNRLVEIVWEEFRDGGYGACLKSPNPKTVVQKALLVAGIKRLLALPREADPQWETSLRSKVNALDKLELPFAEYDRMVYGSTTRDRLITNVKEKYPHIFA